MNMIKLSIFSFYVLLVQIASAQEVLSSGGDISSNASGISMSYTIGELVCETYTSTTHFQTQGYQQSMLSFSIFQVQGLDKEITVSPNPSSQYINLRLEFPTQEYLRYELYDIKGNLIDKGPMEMIETIIPIHHLKSAEYLLNILVDKVLIDQFKIIKL